MFQVLRKMLVLSLAAAVVVGVVAAFASAATKPPSKPTITFASPPSPNDGATLTTTNSGSFAFSYNRTATQTTTLTCALVGPTPTSTPLTRCDAVTAIPGGGGSLSGMPFSGLPDGAYTFTVTLTLTDHGTASATRHFVVNLPPCSVVNTRTHVPYTDLAPAITAANAGDELDITGTCTGNYTVGKNLTLQGINTAGAKATLDGNQTGTVLSFDPNLTFTVNNLTIQNGHGINGGGVAIHDSSTFAFNHDTVIHNTADRTGGGFYIDDVSTGTLYDVVVTENSALVGGTGVDSVNSSTTFDASTVTANLPTLPDRPDLVTADDVNFANPDIAYYNTKGAIQMLGPSVVSTVVMYGATNISADLASTYTVVASTSWGAGTPMCAKDQETGLAWPTLQAAFNSSAPYDTLQLEGTCQGQTIFTHNISVFGPGVLDGGGSVTPVIVNQGVTVSLNYLSVMHGKGVNGGGIRNDGTVGMFHTTVSGNNATGSGGGIYNTGDLQTYNAVFTDNHAATGSGGGIANFGTILLTGSGGPSDISNNTASDGGGVYNDGAFVMTYGSIHGNTASSTGGGIAMFGFGSSVDLFAVTITGNTASDGGGVFQPTFDGTLTYDASSSITGNTPQDISHS
jgi:predicted outer membrane repeat protein